MLFLTPEGWGLLLVGGAVGALFAAFSFAISVFAMPMLIEEETDAMSALGISMAIVWNNLRVMLAWGAIVLALFLASVATLGLGLILVFPVLGHGTWHAYRALRGAEPQAWRASACSYARPDRAFELRPPSRCDAAQPASAASTRSGGLVVSREKAGRDHYSSCPVRCGKVQEPSSGATSGSDMTVPTATCCYRIHPSNVASQECLERVMHGRLRHFSGCSPEPSSTPWMRHKLP